MRQSSLGTGAQVPNTPAPILTQYMKAPLIWVCPKRKRGLTYATQGGTFDPSVTGFLSYGFNDCGCFGQAAPKGDVTGSSGITGSIIDEMVVPTLPFNYTQSFKASDLVAVIDISGSNDPKNCDGNGGTGITGDAAWMDGPWAMASGSSSLPSATTQNYRLQTAWGKHNNRVNLVYLDGHTSTTYVSALTWGEFYGIYGPALTRGQTGYPWPSPPNGQLWNAPIASVAMDTTVVNVGPE